MVENREILLVGNLNANFVLRQRSDGVREELKDSYKVLACHS